MVTVLKDPLGLRPVSTCLAHYCLWCKLTECLLPVYYPGDSSFPSVTRYCFCFAFSSYAVAKSMTSNHGARVEFLCFPVIWGPSTKNVPFTLDEIILHYSLSFYLLVLVGTQGLVHGVHPVLSYHHL